MKKRLTKLLLLAVGLIVGVSAMAQKDVTAQYITNATLSSLEGWTKTGAFGSSVKGNNTTGYATEAYAGWSSLDLTSYSLTQDITLPAGNYTLVCYAFFRQGEAYNTNAAKTLAYLKAGDQQVAIKTLGSITAAGYANSQAEGANVFDSKMYRNTLDIALTSEQTINIGVTGTFDEMRSWCIVGQFELIDNNQIATMDGPFDVTGYITNPGFEYRNVEGWTQVGGGFAAQGNTSFDNKAGGYYAERWQSSGGLSDRSMSQTVTNIPNGLYQLSVYCSYGGTGAYVKANNNSKDISANISGKYTVSTVVDNNQIVIEAGLKDGTANWVCWDRFELKYCGDATVGLNNLRTQATNMINNDVFNATVKSNLQSLVNSTANPADYLQAIDDITAAIENAKTSIDNYAAAKALLDAASSMDDSGKAAYAADATVTALQAAYDARTLEAVTADQKTACEAALIPAAKAQTTAGSDMTLAISNWDFLNCTNGNFPGWSISAPNGGNTWTHGTTCVEYWIGTAANGSFDYYQTVTGLPVGKYKLSASMWNSTNGEGGAAVNGNAGVYGSGVNTVFAGVTADSGDNALGTYTTDEVIVGNGELRLGVKNNGTMGARWFGVDWIKLTYVGGDVTAADVAALEATIPSGAMNLIVATTLGDAKETLENEATWANYEALANAIAAANASIEAYANAAQWLPVNKAELESTNFYTATAYAENITDVEAGLQDATLSNEKAASLTDIRTAWHTANYIDDILMSAWDAEVMDWEGYHVNTWSTEGDNDGSDFTAPFIEYWTGDANALGEKTLTGTITDLEPGSYAVTAWVRARVKNGATAAPYGITMEVNNGTATAVEGTKIGTSQFYLQKVSAFGIVGADGKLTLKFNVAADNNVSWLSFKNVNYMKGASTLADFKTTTEPTLLNLAGTEAILVKDGITYVQDATTGLAIKGYTIDGITDANRQLSGQLYGTLSGDTIIVDAESSYNSVTVSVGEAQAYNATAADAAAATNTFRLLTLNMAEISLTDGVYYANIDNGKVEIDNRLVGDGLVLNAGELVNTLTGVTFLAADGTHCVLAPRSQDDMSPLLWKAADIEIGEDFSGDNTIALNTNDVMARLATLKAGDVLNVEISSNNAGTVEVRTTAGEKVFAISFEEGTTTVEIPITSNLVDEVQKHGLVIEGLPLEVSGSYLRAKYITVLTGKYYENAHLDDAIWLSSDGAVIPTLGAFHFKDVRTGDKVLSDAKNMYSYDDDDETNTATFLTDTPFTDVQAKALLDNNLVAAYATYATYVLGDDPRDDIFAAEAGDSYAQGQTIVATDDEAVNGLLMTYGGGDAEGTKYTYVEVYPEVNKFATATEGIGQVPVDNEDKAYDKAEKNVPTKGTYYVFEPTKDGQLEVTVGVEKGKTLFVTEDGEAIVEQKETADFDGSVTFPVEATKTYYVFAPETNAKLYGYRFTPADANADNTARDIATFKLLAPAADGKADRLLLNDAVVTYIKGDNVFVEDASGAIDFYETRIQFYVGQVLNGYIEGSNGTVDNMPVLKRVEGRTQAPTFKVTGSVTPEAKTIAVGDAVKAENLARFAKLEYVELSTDRQGLRILADIGTLVSVHIEDHFNVLFDRANLFEKIEGIVGINQEGTYVFWPTSKEGVVASDGYKRAQETELDVTNKDEAKTKNNPVVGVSITLDGACNAGSGSAMAGAMTSKGYKLRTANGSPDANSAKFTVNEGKVVYDMVINGVANYAAKDATLPCIKVTKVEVDGNEVGFEGGEFPAKGAADCGTLTLKDINATQSIVIYFDNSNAAGTQINIAYAVNYRGAKIFTSKDLSLIEEAKELAKDREAIAVGCLDDAIEVAEAGNTEGLQAAIDKFKAANANTEKDETSRVGTENTSWKKFDGSNAGVCATQYAPAITTYDGRTVQLAESYEGSADGVNRTGDIIYQNITGLTNGTYKVGFYANAFFTSGRGFESPMSDGATDVAYVFANNTKMFIPGKIATSTTENSKREFQIEITDGNLKIGLGKDKAGTNWHTIQIYQLTWFTTAKGAFNSEKAKLQAAIDEAEELLAGDQIGGKANLQAAVDVAKETMTSIRKYIEDITAEVANLQAAIEKFHAAGKVYVQNVATGKYLAAGSSWGTHAVLNDTGLDYALTTNDDGTKNFDSQVSNGGANNYLNGEWNDGAAFGWTVSQLSNGNYTIYNGTQYLSAGDDNLVVLSDNADEWRFVTADERREALAAATSSAPVDATFLIKGANFGRNDKRNSSWTVSADCTNKNLSGGNNENNCAESYHSTFTISQIVEDAPAGTYTLTAQGFYRQDDGATEDVPVFFANDETKAIGEKTGTENSMSDASVSFTAGLYALETITVVVAENGTLTVGVKGTGTHQWVIWDNFQLKYYGNGGAVAISETAAEPARLDDGAVYNLRGEKVTGTLKPGLYIKNGRKIVVK